MKNHILALAAVLIASSLCPAANQSTFELKDGTKLEGIILREDEDSYLVEIQVTRTIKDERVIPKEEVLKIRKIMPDVLEFEEIATFAPAPDMLSADEYTARIRKVEKFIEDHPSSSHAPKAREILDELKQEANKIIAGGVKLGGNIIPASDYRANRLEIDARIQEAQIRRLTNDGNLLAALRSFLIFEQDFRGTQPYQALKPLIIQAINSYLATISQQAATYDNRIQQREAAIQRMDLSARRATENAIAAENAAMEARYQAEKATRIGWVTADPYFKPALDDTLNFGRQELARLTATGKDPDVDTGAVFRDTLRKVRATSDATEISAAITEARSSRMPEKYLSILEAAASSTTSP